MIDWEMAYYIRYNSGLELPVKEDKYIDKRLFEIAKRQKELHEELASLDIEIMEKGKPNNE